MAGTQSSGMIKQQFHGNNYDQLDRRPTCHSRLERFRMRPEAEVRPADRKWPRIRDDICP
ncbi:MAG: hypothetical protein DWI22_12350 [Planctomycetota bacterium]|nr:MAG: hypothetical protein DWI22_12350 [Planctomycetota bacterium]